MRATFRCAERPLQGRTHCECTSQACYPGFKSEPYRLGKQMLIGLIPIFEVAHRDDSACRRTGAGVVPVAVSTTRLGHNLVLSLARRANECVRSPALRACSTSHPVRTVCKPAFAGTPKTSFPIHSSLATLRSPLASRLSRASPVFHDPPFTIHYPRLLPPRGKE